MFLKYKDDNHYLLRLIWYHFFYFLDNIDTRTSLEAIRDLVTTANIYLRDKRQSGQDANGILLKNIAQYITEILSIFGAIPKDDTIGFPVGVQAQKVSVMVSC